MSENTEQLREKYTEILISNGIQDEIAEVSVSDSGAKGDGMASVTQCVTVTFEDQVKPQLNLFVKLHSQNPTHEAMLTSLKAFEKEAEFFMEYLPAAKAFCKTKGLNDLLDFFPKCYYGDENMIVLENLVIEKGYGLLSYDERHDFTTASIVLEALEKMHAVSYAMIQENGGKDQFFKKFTNLEFNGMASPMMVAMMVGFSENALKTCTTIVKNNKIDGYEETLTKLSKLKPSDGVTESLCKKEDDLLVLNHGDFKNNNMMFLKDKDTNALLHLIFIDLQGACYKDAVSDIANYLFTSVDPNLRQLQVKDLLNVYRDTLNKVSRDFGYPVELSYEDLLIQYRRKFKLGFFYSMTLVGPGMGLFKTAGVDINEIDMTDLANVFQTCLFKWIKENPEKGREMAEEIKNLVDEYKTLEL